MPPQSTDLSTRGPGPRWTPLALALAVVWTCSDDTGGIQPTPDAGAGGSGDAGPAMPDVGAERGDASVAGHRLELRTDAPIATVDPRFLSFAIDTSQVVGGYWWQPDATRTGSVGAERVDPFDFADPTLRALAAPLAPALLRVGGSEADRVYYHLADDAAPDPLPEGYEFAFTREMYDGLHAFTDAVGYDVFFTLNSGPGPRDEANTWDPAQARALMTYSVEQGYDVDVWELGNEINGYVVFHGFRLSGAEYAADMAKARALVDELDPGALLAGPSSAFWPRQGEPLSVMPEFMEVGGDLIDVLTWHYYPQHSRRCPVASRRAGLEVLLDPEPLDELGEWAGAVEAQRDAHNPDAQVWLGETGNSYCGGEPGVSDAFVGSLWWIDHLGTLAARGQQVVVRQTLVGSNYGVLREQDLSPNPDYWASILWKRLMGQRVLQVESDAPPTLRAYAHCAPEGGAVTLALVNIDAAPIDVALPGADASVWLLTAPALDTRSVHLNGDLLRLRDGTGLPAMGPETRQGRTLTLPPRSYAFVSLPDAGGDACSGTGAP
jgi:heparanase 1